MKNMRRIISFVLATLMVLFCLTGCGSSGSSGKSEHITSSSAAISKAKNYLKGTSFSLEQRIAGELGFKSFASPSYGTSSANERKDGSWDVTVKGSMSGYTDDYRSKFETFKFEARANVSEDGKVSGISVKKVR